MSQPPTKPAWRKAFDAVERRVAKPVESGVRTDAFNDAMAALYRTRRDVQRTIERQTRRALHLANVPSATDVKQVSDQVAALHRELRVLQRELDRRNGR
ncbi:MAG: hypothetical protein QOI80_2831 [Solirubrobacteraceae bacterium]|nr:hypothetical protein [Solirubrobacteraceae bacterium]